MQLVNEFDRINQQLKMIKLFSCIVELNWRREISFYYNSLLSSWDVTPSFKPIEIQSVAMLRYIQMCADKIQCISKHTSCLFSWIFSLFLYANHSYYHCRRRCWANRKWMEACDFLCGCRWINHHTRYLRLVASLWSSVYLCQAW